MSNLLCEVLYEFVERNRNALIVVRRFKRNERVFVKNDFTFFNENSDYEEKDSFLFESKEKTEEDWAIDCKKAIKEVGESYLQKQKADEMWVCSSDWIEMASEKLKEYGYQSVKPASWGYWGQYY